MTGAEAAAADSHDHDEVEDIELDHILGFRVKEMARSSINNTCIDRGLDTGVDVQAKEFDLDFSGQADQVQVPNIDFGSTEPGASVWSVDELL